MGFPAESPERKRPSTDQWPRRLLPPQSLGLYDMNGNVAEWTASDYIPYPLKEKANKETAEKKVVRGGSLA
ncbi:MAG: SUMF1/EgtB/PvdO family nonheme iron enzyme [Parabacteroides johnsonii]